MKKITKSLVMLLVVFALTVTACANQQGAPTQNTAPAVSPALSSGTVVGEGHIKPVHAANLSFQARGTVEEVAVKIGDRVNRGDVLARLSNASQAEAGLASASLEL
ncbi:MAG TPA: efflux RND transporter periplasmic adaptor subunit, partial [Anaerolineales bacterium]|nr:efflux RND transporter periplasmic adaptor subunit [Anaerolineales bacterium]